jgi:hypothetical protein
MTLGLVIAAPTGAAAASTPDQTQFRVSSRTAWVSTSPPPAAGAMTPRSTDITAPDTQQDNDARKFSEFTPPWGGLDLVRFAMIALIAAALLYEGVPLRR